jgi:hypothetical protein
MSANDPKQILRDLRKQSPTLKLSDRKYKHEYSRTVWALVETIVDENERLEKRTEMLEDMLKMLVNQSQLAISESRNLRKSIAENTVQLGKLKALPASDDDYSEESDLKGE